MKYICLHGKGTGSSGWATLSVAGAVVACITLPWSLSEARPVPALWLMQFLPTSQKKVSIHRAGTTALLLAYWITAVCRELPPASLARVVMHQLAICLVSG